MYKVGDKDVSGTDLSDVVQLIRWCREYDC
ncbi:MAG: hypothetical protein ACLR2O_10190 [Coprococcus sp.]